MGNVNIIKPAGVSSAEVTTLLEPKLDKLLTSRTQNVAGGYTTVAGDAFNTIYVSGASATITLDNFAADQWVYFYNTTGNTYTFAAGTGGITSENATATGASDGKLTSTKLGTMVGAFYDGTNWNLIGKLT